jgi:diguanylate cyclase (GGDEF)-like protein/PAS domain S-box-containing protein
MPGIQDLEIFRTVLDSLQTGVCVMDRQCRVLFWNQGAERITGFQSHEVVGHQCRETTLPSCDGRACAYCGATCPFAGPVLDGKSIEARVELRHKEGHRIPVRAWVVPVRDARGHVTAIAESFDRQIHTSEQDRREHNLAVYGCLDEVTGIPNEGFTRFHLRENLAGFEQYHLPFGIMLIRVDALDRFTAAYGREAAGAILRVVAQTVKNALRPSDFLGRWDENEFVAIVLNANNAGVAAAAERTRRLVNCAGLKWWGDQLQVTTSVGQAAAQAEDTIESLLERALRSLESGRTKAAVGGSPGGDAKD